MSKVTDVDLGEGFHLRQTQVERHVRGTTCSRGSAEGMRVRWTLTGPACPPLEFWDNHWGTHERDICLGRQEVVPRLPRPVVNLLGRRRATVEMVGDKTVMTLRLVTFDRRDWPHFSQCDRNELEEECGPGAIRRMQSLGVTRIGTKDQDLGRRGRTRSQLCAVLDEGQYPAAVIA
jgi:hypothetical protein